MRKMLIIAHGGKKEANLSMTAAAVGAGLDSFVSACANNCSNGGSGHDFPEDIWSNRRKGPTSCSCCCNPSLLSRRKKIVLEETQLFGEFAAASTRIEE